MKELFQEKKKEKENQKKHVGSSLLGINGTFLLQDGVDLDWKELLGSLQSLVSRNACQVSVGQGGDGSIPMGMLSIPKASNWCI